MINKKRVSVVAMWCGIFLFGMSHAVYAAWEDRTDPVWWPGTGYLASWTGTQWNAGTYEAILMADPGEPFGDPDLLEGSTFAGERPTKIRVTHNTSPVYVSLTNVGGGETLATDNNYVSMTELDIVYPTGTEDIGRLYFGGSGITKIEFYFEDSGGGDSDTDAQGQNLSATIQETMTLSCGADVDLDNSTVLISETPLSNMTTCTVTTNDAEGYSLSVVDDRGVANALYHATLSGTVDGQIVDKTAWDPTGSGNAQVWSGTGLGFGVLSSEATKNDTWWGTGVACNDANQKYAGFPHTDMNIVEHTAYTNTATDTNICYQVNVPATQIAGEYTGSVTYTATGRP